VRVDTFAADGSRDRETWDSVATLSADGGVTLSTNQVMLRNGAGSTLVTFTGGGDFNLSATIGGVQATRALRSAAGDPITRVGGTLSGGSSTWSGIVAVTNDLTITNHVLTIQSNTLVLLRGTNAGTAGADIIVNANASIQSLGTEAHPVTLTCSNAFSTNRWGQIRHNSSQPSLYRHTFIHRAGRAPGEGHTGQAPAVRPDGTTVTFESCSLTDLCETTAGAPGFGTPGKVMFANNSILTFNDCLFQRARMGPEIQGSSLLFTNGYIMDTRGPDDGDGIYLHDQQVGQIIKLVDSVIAAGDDDGVDTLSSIITVERCILRDWASTVEDAKAISAFAGTVNVHRCLITDSTVGIAAKSFAGTPARVNVTQSTLVNNLTNVIAAYKLNAPGPIIDIRITNCVLWGGNPIHSDFEPLSSNSTNFTIRYTDTGEAWTGAGNINSDPLFVNLAARNLRVQIGSPVIDAGAPGSPLDADGTTSDMGVFPFLTNPDPLIAFSSNWRYLDKGTDQGTNWSARIFDDSSWSNGLAQLGYGDFDEATVVEDNPTPGYTTPVADRFITTYFRREFTVLNPSEFTNVLARLVYDDAAVVYLNGQELFRVNLTGGAFDYLTLALGPVEETLMTTVFSPSLLLVGTNVIAVEMHQQSASSSDISFNFDLAGQRQFVGNQPPAVSITSPSDGTGFIAPANIAITVNATDDAAVTNVSFFQNGALLWQTNAGPYVFNWDGVTVGSYALTASVTDDTGLSSTSATVNVTVSAPGTAVTNVFIGLNSVWKYLDNGTDQGVAWRTNTFNDASWASGQAQLGYGDNDEVTVVQDNPDLGVFNIAATDKYITTYFRRFFNVTNAAAFTNMSLRLLRDDAAVVYLNGGEIFRTVNLPAFPNPVLFNTLATATSPENVFDTVTYGGSLSLLEGTNLIAVEIHQQSQSSSDISFELQLTGIRTADTNARPLVAVSSPVDGTFFGTPASIAISANASDVDGFVTNVAFLVNGVKLGDDPNSPFTLTTNNVPAGSYALAAVATDNVGLSQTSAVVNVTVSTNTAPPVVFAKTPATGSVTNLTSLTVTFSKAVTGVNAGDLLVSGSQATGVSGSGSNYTFTFMQPAYGAVPVTWAAAHGITDLFTPPAAFNTNSAGANWSYTLLDAVPPTITAIDPVPNSTIAALTSISITFSEPVTGVNAGDLLINSVPASGLTGSGAGPYAFNFPSASPGVVNVTWTGSPGIVDASANAFATAPWSYTLDTNASGVVISEIMYHPSSENVLEEYIELFNKGAGQVSLSGWQFTRGVSFTFSNVSIPAGGYFVVAANVAAFTNKYPGVTNVVGGWTGFLNNDSEDIDLDDANGNRVDSVEYADENDWAVRQRGFNDLGFRGWAWFAPHDGGGVSLELINPNLSNNSGQNWGASTNTQGTPGAANSIYRNNTAPMILDTTHFPTLPRSTDAIVISARIVDETPSGLVVNLKHRVDSASPPAFSTLAMHDDGVNGDASANDGLYSALIPAQANNAVIEFYIEAADAQANARTWPAPAIGSPDGGVGPIGQVVNAVFQVDDVAYTGAAPLYKMILTTSEYNDLANVLSASPNSDASMNMTFISIDGAETLTHYLVSVRNRGHGSRFGNPHNYRVGFNSDQPWKGLAALNLNARVTYAQHFGSTLAQKSGADGASSRAVQLRINGGVGPGGVPTFNHYAANEDLGSDWAGNHFPEDGDGNVYKVVRDLPPSPYPNFDYRNGDVAQYQRTYVKQSNTSENDWTDLDAMLEVMGENRTNLFTLERARSVINVEQWLRHLAVMNLMGNNESGLNTGNNDDYYMYRGVTDPRFILVYHDLDQIIGEGGSQPVNGDIFRATGVPISGDSEGTWRAMGWFMRQPDVEALYYRTLQDLLDTTFSQPEFDALINHTLLSYVPAGTVANMKTWMNARRAYVQGVITGLVPPATNHPVATILGEPRSPSPARNATLTIGGTSITSYRFSLNAGAYGADTPVGTPISLSNLPQGSTNTVRVVGQNSGGIYQSTNAPTVSLTWIVNTNTPSVRLNEVLAANDAAYLHAGTTPDIIELFNDGAASVNLGGLRLTDDKDVPGKFTFPGTMLAPGAYLIVFANNDDGSGGIHTGFSLDPDGDQVYLFDRATNGNAVLDVVKFGRQITDLSIGRTGAGGTWVLTTPTIGSANAAQALASENALKINEWLALSATVSDFVEIYNPGVQPVSLGGLYLTDTPIGAPALSRIHDLSFLGANGYASFTADGDGGNPSHANFQLPSEQGQIALLTATFTTIDSISYGPQQPDIAQGKCPNGGATYATLVVPTPGAPNSCSFVPPLPVTVTLLTISNVWSYQPRTNYDAVNWTTNTYNDATWPTGPALLGRQSFNSNQVWPEPFRTAIETNFNQTNFYFRAHFNVAAGATYTSLQLRHIIDDSAVFYLNGVEIPGTRFNLPGGTINGTVFASSTISVGSYRGPFTVPISMLRTGDNVFAVDVHQSANNSSDVAMGVELQALIVTNSPAAAGVLINEVLANNLSLEELDGSKPDWVEIYNPSTNAVDLGDMSLTDATTTPRRWVIPGGTILGAQSFVKFRFDANLPASATNTGFGLKANGGAVFLFNRLADGGSLLSSVAYGLQAADFSIGRIPNGSTNWALNIPTLGGGNLVAALGNPLLLRLNEWMASPAPGNVDYFEVFNPNPQPVDISRFYLTDDLLNRTKHQLPTLSFLGIGEEAFQEFKANSTPLVGADHVGFSLAAGGEALGLTHSNLTAIDSISFGPQSAGVSQGRLPDGAAGIVNFTTTPTPGNANFLPLNVIVINELLAHTDAPLEDAVELYNPTSDSVDISGWYLSDSQDNLFKYRIPSNTVVAAYGYKVFYEYQFNSEATQPFSLSSAKGDEVYLSQSFSAGTATGYRAFATFGASENGVSFGRFVTSLGSDFTALSARTFGMDNPVTTNQFRTGTGLTNVYPKVGPLVFNEVMYNFGGGVINDGLEFLELRNVTAAPLTLYDVANPQNTWRIRKGVDFNFPANTTVPAGGYLVLVNFDPVNDPSSLTTFTNTYGAGYTILGPYSGRLNNDGEAVEIQKPDAPQTTPGPDFGLVPYIVVDRVNYDDAFPWPQVADGSGWSLSKLTATLYGNEAFNWQGNPPTPGAVNFDNGTNSPPALTTIADRSVHAGYAVSFTAIATDPDLPGQSLTFSLINTVPSGAGIGSSSGMFTWTPTTNQIANHTITVRVTDNGTPNLSDTKTFNIAVLALPRVQSVFITNGVANLVWNSHPGRRYQIFTTPTLTPANWVPYGGDIIANSTTMTVPVGNPGDPTRFYQVVSFDN